MLANGTKWAAVDIETANEDPSSICSLGVTFAEDGQITDTATFLVSPDPPHFNGYNTYIHGLTERDVRGAPTLPEVWQTLEPALGNRMLIAHCAGFDMGGIRRALDGSSFGPFNYVCSRAIARRTWPDLPSYALSYVACHLGISFDHHLAGEDARACAMIALAACEHHGTLDLVEVAEKIRLRVGSIDLKNFRSSRLRPNATPPKRLTPDADEFDEEHPFFGRAIVFTGTLQSMVRADAMQLVVNSGGTCGGSVSKRTAFLVVGDQDYSRFVDGQMSTKMRKATELRNSGADIEIIGEEDFLNLLAG